MAVSLANRWEWSVGADGYVWLADAVDEQLLAFSPDSGVAALRVQGAAAELVWRFPDPAGESINLVGALDGGGRTRVFVAFQQGWSAPTVVALSAIDGALYWRRDLDQGSVYSVAADARLVYLHHGSRAGHLLRVLDAQTGTEVDRVPVPETITPLVTAAEGRLLYGAGTAVVELDTTTGASRVLADRVLRPAGDQQLGSVIAAGQRVYATDGSAAVAAIDHSPGGGILWRQVLPGQPELGDPVYDAGLDAVVVGGLNGEVYCLDASDGAVRWVSRCEGPSTSQTVGVPTVVRGAAGAFVVYPGVDETLYLVDGVTGGIMDRVRFAWPLEVTLHARAGEVLVPHALGVSAFELRA